MSNYALTWQGQRASHSPMKSTPALSNDADFDRSGAYRAGGTVANAPLRDEDVRLSIKNQGAHLYFIKLARSRGPVKIGRANNPNERLKALQVACPYEMKLLGILEGCGDYEIGWHCFLASDRMRGEWFAWSKSVEGAVKVALNGGDWRSVISQRRARPAPTEDWWAGSPLYEPRPGSATQKG
jgi:hypothetical protein